VRSEFAPPLGNQLELLPPDASPPGARLSRPISAADAEISALTAVEADQAPYGSRMDGATLMWEFVEAIYMGDAFLVKLRFRKVGAPPQEFGEEDVQVDKWGDVRVRQIRSWPKTAGRGFSIPFIYGGTLLALALTVGMGILYLLG
jgi:hypothetical protein